MAGKNIPFVILLFVFTLYLSGCKVVSEAALPGASKIPADTSSSEIAPTLAQTKTPIPQDTATPDLKNKSTETKSFPIASLSGVVTITGKKNEPFVTILELRGRDTLWLQKTTTTDRNGKFKILDIEPGDYELWVLLTTEAKMISGCNNIFVPDNQWRIGIKYPDTARQLGSIEGVSINRRILRWTEF